MIGSVVTSSQGSGGSISNSGNSAMDDHANAQHTMHQLVQQGLQQQQQQQSHSGGIDQQQRLDGALVGNFGSNAPHNHFQPQQQQQQPNRQPLDLNNQSYNGGASNANSVNITNEIKRLQQLHQLGGGGLSSNALLMNPGSSSQDAATSAFLQSMFEQFSPDTQQQQQKSNFGGNNRFESQLTGGMIVPSNTNNNASAQSLSNPQANNSIPMQLPSNFLNDARFLMAQNQVFQQSQNMPFAMMPQPQEQSLCGTIGMNQEMPLPSPHSLFHRDGSRRMRGGVIEPFPGTGLLAFALLFNLPSLILFPFIF